MQHPELLDHVGRNDRSKEAEQFVMRLYKEPKATSLKTAQFEMFNKGKKEIEKRPLTQDAFKLHLARVNHQASIWYQATKQTTEIASPEDTIGWSKTEKANQLNIVWTRLPSMSQSTFDIVTCGCTTQCGTARCSCVRNGLVCIPACWCDAQHCSNSNSLPLSK